MTRRGRGHHLEIRQELGIFERSSPKSMPDCNFNADRPKSYQGLCNSFFQPTKILVVSAIALLRFRCLIPIVQIIKLPKLDFFRSQVVHIYIIVKMHHSSYFFYLRFISI
jgi:hypothetical protein